MTDFYSEVNILEFRSCRCQMENKLSCDRYRTVVVRKDLPIVMKSYREECLRDLECVNQICISYAKYVNENSSKLTHLYRDNEKPD